MGGGSDVGVAGKAVRCRGGVSGYLNQLITQVVSIEKEKGGIIVSFLHVQSSSFSCT